MATTVAAGSVSSRMPIRIAAIPQAERPTSGPSALESLSPSPILPCRV